ncbi:MAG: DNA polymerase I, partial [Clostridia bacterium]|nr:DNA polymerase I [Clostridia bacterium]
EKTASKLISEYQSLDGVYNSLDAMKPGKTLDNLIADTDKAYLSQYLAKIVTDAPLDVGLEDIKRTSPDREMLLNLLSELEFSVFINRLGLNNVKSKIINKRDATDKDLFDLKGEIAVLSVENAFEFYAGEEILVRSLSDGIPSGFFESGERQFITHDLKTLLHTLDGIGINSVNCIFDVMLAGYVLNPSENNYSVERLSVSYLGSQGSDVGTVYKLKPVLDRKMKEISADGLFYDIEMPLATVLFRMEKRGMLLDKEGIIAYGKELEAKAGAIEKQIFDEVGHSFNISSPKQLGTVLFEELGLPSGKKTKSGYSTAADVLEKLRGFYPVVDMVLEYRQLIKLKSTYCDGLPECVSEDGRVHTSFNQTVTATGRLSSTEPNLQNIPIRTEMGSRLRKFFPSPDGYVLIDADYSQIELRLLAHISGDRNMIDGFNSGEDIHRITASQVFGVPFEDVTPELRKRAKAVNFGIVYGIGEYSLAQDLHISMKQASEYMNAYKQKYSGVTKYLSSAIENAYRDGYVTTMNGRRRYIAELTASQKPVRSFGERVAMNSPIQGSAADVIKIAMIRTEKELSESGLDAKLIMQVHDELIVEASEKDAQKAAEILRKCMESAADLSVELSVDLNVGENWLECH